MYDFPKMQESCSCKTINNIYFQKNNNKKTTTTVHLQLIFPKYVMLRTVPQKFHNNTHENIRDIIDIRK